MVSRFDGTPEAVVYASKIQLRWIGGILDLTGEYTIFL